MKTGGGASAPLPFFSLRPYVVGVQKTGHKIWRRSGHLWVSQVNKRWRGRLPPSVRRYAVAACAPADAPPRPRNWILRRPRRQRRGAPARRLAGVGGWRLAAAAVLFYYFDWKADASILSGLHRDNPDPSLPDEVENPCGYAGAWLAEQLVGRSFGVFGIVLPLIVTMIGVRIIRRRPLLLNHSALSSLLVLLLGSLTLGFLFGDAWDVFGSGWGGAFGIEIARLLRGVIGAVGVSILLLGGWILTGVFINRNFINTVNSAGSAVVGKGGRFVERVKRSVVHPSAARQTPTDSPQEADGDDAAAGPKDTNKTESSEPEPGTIGCG